MILEKSNYINFLTKINSHRKILRLFRSWKLEIEKLILTFTISNLHFQIPILIIHHILVRIPLPALYFSSSFLYPILSGLNPKF